MMHICRPNDRLRELRVARKVSRKQLSTSLGISHFTLGRWERGESFPSPDMVEKLCTFFQLSPFELGLVDAVPSSVSPMSQDTTPFIRSRAGKDGGLVEEGVFSSSLSHAAIIDPMIPLPIVSGLVGRAGLLIRLVQRLCSYQRSVVTVVHGLPGMGKTAMATAISHNIALRKHFVDGILWTGLGPHPNLLSILGRWGKILGISTTEMSTLTSIESWSKALRTTIGTRKFLIVLDDAWQLEEVLACKVGGENCQYLVTTRFPSLASQLTIDGMIQLQELSEEASIALLDALVMDVNMADVPQVPELVRSVGGLPLALTLIGSYVRAQLSSEDGEGEGEEDDGRLQRIQRALQQLEDTAVRLQISEPNLPVESHPSLEPDTMLSLQSIIAVTEQFLSPAARIALYIFSLLPAKPNSFSEDVALAVANCTTDTLDVLVESGLLECTVGERYTLHQVIADYARLHLTTEDKEHAVNRLIAYSISYIHEHKRDYELLSRESSTLVATLDLAYEMDQQEGLVRLVCAFAPYMILRGFYSLAEQHLQRAYEAVEVLNDEEGLAEVLLYQGEIALKQSNLTLAEERLEAGLQIATRLGNKEYTCDLLTDLGSVAWRRGQYTHAEELLQRGLSIARHIESRERMERILKIMGSVFANQGKFVQAVESLQEGLTLARQIGDREQICVLLSNIGAVFGEQGNMMLAEEYFCQGLELARQIEHREQVCVSLINLGNIKKDLNDFVQAEKYFSEGLVLARHIGHDEWVSVLLCNLASIALTQDNATQAEIYLRESLDLARSVTRPQIICNVLHEYGYFYLILHETTLAKDTFREMLQTVPLGDQQWYAFAYYGLARVAALENKMEEAHQLGSISLQVLESIGHGRAQEVQSWLSSLPQ